MKKTKLLTSLAALGLVISLGACETTAEECEECPTCPEVTEPTDEDDEAWVTTPAELIDLASETMNYSVGLEFDTWESAEVMAYSDYNRMFDLDDALYEFYDPDLTDEEGNHPSLWDDETNDWVTGDAVDESWTDGAEARYDELYAEFLDLYAEYEALFDNIDVTSSYAVDIFVDEDYMLAVTYEWQDVTDYTENEDAEADWEYVFDSLDMYVSDGEGGCIEITYAYENLGNMRNPDYQWVWHAYSCSYPWMYYEYSLFSTSSVYNFDNFFDYYASGTLSGIPCTAWTISDDASLWGLEYDLAFMLGAYTYWQGDYTSYPDYMAYYYSHYLTYFMEDYQEMLMNFYYANIFFTDRTYSNIYYYEDDVWIDLYDVGATDATTEINEVIAAYNASLVVEPEEGNDSSSSSED